MRKLLLLRRVPVFALMVLAIFACSSGFKPGSLGAVEIERGQPIENPRAPFRFGRAVRVSSLTAIGD